jgi:excisionase family DNA binding protein
MTLNTHSSRAPVASEDAPDTSLLLDIRGAAALLGITPWQVRGLVATGGLNVVRIGRKFYFRRASLVRWTERSEERAA